MKKIGIKLLFIFCFFSLKAQTFNCEVAKDTLYYITFDVRSNSSHPVIMSGVSKKLNICNFSRQDVGSFVDSFYKEAFYAPETVLGGYNSLIVRCMGEEAGKKFIKENPESGLEISFALDRNSYKSKFKFSTGETVFISVSKIIGEFWIVNKGDLSTNSNELNIKKINAIDKCYVPFKISSYIKPKKKEIDNFKNK